MKRINTEAQLSKLLKHRYDRLVEEYKMNAPTIIKITELQLISEAALDLKEFLSKNIKE